MTPLSLDRIRTHRRPLAAKWVEHAGALPRTSFFWQDATRTDRHLLAGLDALHHAGKTGAVEPFVEFAGRLSQEAFALQVPLDELIRVLLGLKPIILDFLAEQDAPSASDVDTIQFLNRLISVGIIEVIRRHERRRDQRALALRDQIDELRSRLRHQALIDTVTGLLNANSFALAVRREVQRSRRFDRTFTIGLVALDRDEEIKDSIGDEGLRAVTIHLAGIITHTLRQVDLRAALGTARFGIILPETSLEGSFALAERLRTEIEKAPFAIPDHPVPMTHTVSIGLACFPRDGADEQLLLQRAEEALARARAGRNTTVAAASSQDF
jgi:diguanylate cyclase (GGDEF)-like protein